jgi:hypothetical protein
MKLKKYCFPVFLFTVTVAAIACKQGDDAAVPVGDKSLLNVINAVTDTKAINFYLNGTRQNTKSAIYLFNSSGYTSVPTGEEQYQFKSDSPRTEIMNIKLSLARKDSSYTVVVAGQISSNNLATIFVNDYFPTDTTRQSKVRFIQASPGNTQYDVFVGDTLSFKNQDFKSVTPFMNVGPGVKTVRITRTGSTVPLVEGTVTLQANTYYTLFTEGLLNGSGDNALGAVINLTK